MTSSQWRKNSMTWGKRLVIVILIMGGIIYGVLSLAARYKEPMRLGLEDYLETISGQDAEITDLAKLQLIPNVIFGIRGINLREITPERKVLIHADKAYISVPFLNLIFGINSYHAFEIKGMSVATGYWLPKKLDITIAGISDKANTDIPPSFLIEGKYNNLPVLITAEMDRKAGKKFYKYSFNNSFPVTFKLGALEGDGIFERGLTNATFKRVQMVKGEDRAEFVMRKISRAPLYSEIEGTINDVPFNAVLTKSGQSNLLQITPQTADPKDIKKVQRLVDSISKDIGWSGKDDELKIEITSQETKAE